MQASRHGERRPGSITRGVAALTALTALTALWGWSAPAQAACPKSGDPDLSVCVYSNAWMVPSLQVGVWTADDRTLAAAGARVELYQWKDNSPGFSPSHGAWYAELSLVDRAGPGRAHAWIYGAAGRLSFEGNASRRWLIPYYGAMVGAVSQAGQPRRLLARADLGVSLWHSDALHLWAQAGYQRDASSSPRWRGATGQLGLTWAPWR